MHDKKEVIWYTRTHTRGFKLEYHTNNFTLWPKAIIEPLCHYTRIFLHVKGFNSLNITKTSSVLP